MPRNETGKPCNALFMCEDGILLKAGIRPDGLDFISFETDRNVKQCQPNEPPLAVVARFPQDVSMCLTFDDLIRLVDVIRDHLELRYDLSFSEIQSVTSDMTI